MRDDRQRLTDIVEAANLILGFRTARQRTDLTEDLLLRSGFLHQLYVIGEAASRLSPTFKAQHAAVSWQAISGFRNYIAHEYFSLDLVIIWQTVMTDVPALKAQVESILTAFDP